MTTEIIIVLTIFALLIITPIIFSIIRDIDYKRQLSGKKSTRNFKKEQFEKTNDATSPEMEAAKVAADMHRQQDVIGL